MNYYRKYVELYFRRYAMALYGSRQMSPEQRAVILCDGDDYLDRLTYQERTMIHLVAVMGHSQAEASATIGVSLRTGLRIYGSALDSLSQHMLSYAHQMALVS